jgi:hypothetical protein
MLDEAQWPVDANAVRARDLTSFVGLAPASVPRRHTVGVSRRT